MLTPPPLQKSPTIPPENLHRVVLPSPLKTCKEKYHALIRKSANGLKIRVERSRHTICGEHALRHRICQGKKEERVVFGLCDRTQRIDVPFWEGVCMSEAPECRLVKWALCVGVALVMWAASNTPGMFTRQTDRDGSPKKIEHVWPQI